MRKIIKFECTGETTELQLPRHSVVRQAIADGGDAVQVFVEVDAERLDTETASMLCIIHLVETDEDIPYDVNTAYINSVITWQSCTQYHCFATYKSLTGEHFHTPK